MARLAFCKFMVKPSTLLVLLEPTNHLDIPSKEMFEEAISEYQEIVITVSHDQYFIRQIVNRVVEVKDKGPSNYVGDYNYYLEKNLEARENFHVRQSLRRRPLKNLKAREGELSCELHHIKEIRVDTYMVLLGKEPRG
ncbi:ABC transporter F family member 2-like [Dioscorea cayenensis subsp. rotundata]|uniref:ABC transporter F family member 2-like n=1 Tax=Dioscorea cayennensis subsp. rotundata TaxID=55577 RepID=A0AB40D469_DIOCR|nr:ABC transporter F family member 2-like [Dioscorea cayenensis subsp. rotundata]